MFEKKSILNYQEKLYLNISKACLSINKLFKFNFPVKDTYRIDDLKLICNILEYEVERLKIEFVYGKGNRKTLHHRYYEQFNDFKDKIIAYENHIKIFGDRNSYSKTDYDATFIHGKEDYYNNDCFIWNHGSHCCSLSLYGAILWVR